MYCRWRMQLKVKRPRGKYFHELMKIKIMNSPLLRLVSGEFIIFHFLHDIVKLLIPWKNPNVCTCIVPYAVYSFNFVLYRGHHLQSIYRHMYKTSDQPTLIMDPIQRNEFHIESIFVKVHIN